MNQLRRGINAVLFLTLIALGGMVMVALIYTKPMPATIPNFSRTPSVAVAEVLSRSTAWPVIGYGTVRPKNQVNIVPEVGGKLIYSHSALAQGNIIPAGELIFEIDPTIYEARVNQVKAEIRGLEAGLQRHDQEVVNLDARVEIVEQMLAIDEKALITSRRLHADKVGRQLDVDMDLLKYLRQNDLLVVLKNQRAMAPHLMQETKARLDAARAKLQQATHNLASTKIVSPFEARVETVNAHAPQYVPTIISIATLTDMSAFEISVGIDPREIRWLDEAVRPSALENVEAPSGPEVTVVWSLSGQEFTWRGYVTRFERFDEATRTGRLVVEVRSMDMVATLHKGTGDTRPTLSIGMHCRAELPAEPLDDALLIPRHTVYEHRWVYVFEPDSTSSDGLSGTLGRREVPLLRSLGDIVLVDYAGRTGTEVCELQAGEYVVLSPLTRPVVGMKITRRSESLAAVPSLPVVRTPIRDFEKIKRDATLTFRLLDVVRRGG
ncbi:MAG: hypothetical protein IIC51_08435 [Planctomycetes bacterium]|nr:hypothetical protein [Planctomycetota bacterium]